MTDSATFEFDMSAFCAAVLREYEEVIETIIQRPVRTAPIEQGPGVGALAVDGTLPSERA
jgi:hypothetical protein